jgi:hypothetical protein
MTQEEKQLLLIDLCARIPCSKKIVVKIGNYSDYTLMGYKAKKDEFIVELIENNVPYYIDITPELIKPYLRPMSSMTEEEKDDFYDNSETGDVDTRTDGLGLYFRGEFALFEDITYAIDWLNAHHFDYRGLIEKGLALVAPENMYKEK